MKQVTEDYRSGVISVADVAAPTCRPGYVLVHTRASVISPGTEGAAVRFGQESLLQKARSRPDLVRQVVDKVRADGLLHAYQVVQARLDVPLSLGYSSAGLVLEAGTAVDGCGVGDRVACAGAGYASHAEVVAVPRNLAVRVPGDVPFEDAAFATLGAVALQGLRVADVRVGERVVVLGLGLIGLLTVQLLKASGCRVLGFDPNPNRVALARELGADGAHELTPSTAAAEAVAKFTERHGADAVIIAAATPSNEPVELAGEWSRLKGRVVAVGDVRLDVPRRTYYQKELDLRVSRSYGPGRYDPTYEEHGIDYPYAYVPFTEQRNMETFLQLVAEGKVTPARLITHRFSIAEADKGYALIGGAAKEPYLGVVLTYPAEPDLRRRMPRGEVDQVKRPGTWTDRAPAATGAGGRVGVGLIGAGNYARQVLLPMLKANDAARLIGVGTSRGLSARHAAERFGFEFSATDVREVIGDDRVQLAVIATRHDSHAALAVAALRAGKHVFVEKPLAIDEEGLRLVVDAAGQAGRHLMVGFNRRFAPLIQMASDKFRGHARPLAMVYRVNAGAVPASHWTQDPEEGGGRIIGEACHFVDLLQYLCGSEPVSVFAAAVAGQDDTVSITIRFADGSVGTILYFANGDKAVAKEYLEVHGAGRTFILEDFRRARYTENGRTSVWRSPVKDKGQKSELEALLQAINNGRPTPIPLEEAVLATLTTFRVLDSLRLGREVPVGWSKAPGVEEG